MNKPDIIITAPDRARLSDLIAFGGVSKLEAGALKSELACRRTSSP
jgi:hypothetical protein